MDNPYDDAPLVGVEAEERQQTVVTDTVTGEGVLAGEEGSRVLVDPAGARAYHGVRRLILAPDRRVVTNPAETYACATCAKGLLSKATVVFCAACQYPACRTCAKNADDGTTVAVVCASCYEHGKIARCIKRWLARLGGFLGWLAKI